jgi:hypothetical protein
MSPCERANLQLRASRYAATVAANVAAGARRTSVARPELRVDTATTVAPKRGGTAQHSLPGSPSMRLQQAAESMRNGMGGLLRPVLRVFDNATRRSKSSAVAAEE